MILHINGARIIELLAESQSNSLVEPEIAFLRV